MTYAFWNEGPTRKCKLSESIWFIAEVFSVTKDAAFLSLKLTITVSYFFKWWHAWRSLGLPSWTVRESALQMLLSKISLLIDIRIGLFSSDSRWYSSLLTVFLSNLTIVSLNKLLQFLVTNSSEERISYLLKNPSKRLVRLDILEDKSSTLTSSLINSSSETFSSWLLVWTTMM